MTADHEQKKPSLEPIDEELAQILIEGRTDDAWAAFVMNERPADLGLYLELGGEVDDIVRQALIEILKNHPKGKKGGSKPYLAWETYLEIETMLSQDKTMRTLIRLGKIEAPEDLPSKKLTRNKAFEIYAGRKNRELHTVEKQYHRGKDVDAQFQKKSTKK
jgi:hypothetical protein